MDYDIQRCTRRCESTGRDLAEGEEVFSALLMEDGRVRRHDYATDAWTGPPDGALGWWKSRIPVKEAKKASLAPSEAMLNLYRELEDQPSQANLRYLLSLLLVRRRLLRLEDSEIDEQRVEWMVIYCPRDEITDRVRVTNPTLEQIAAIETQLTALLDGNPIDTPAPGNEQSH